MTDKPYRPDGEAEIEAMAWIADQQASEPATEKLWDRFLDECPDSAMPRSLFEATIRALREAKPVKYHGSATARPKLDAFGIEAVCDAIGDQKSMTQIAHEQGVSIGSLIAWIDSDPERSARAREVRRSMARFWDEKAEAVLANASSDFELKKARELSQHYRWRAKAIAPAEYGDKVQHADADGNKLEPATFVLQPVAPPPREE